MKSINKHQWGKAASVGVASSLALIAAAPIAMAQEEPETGATQGLILPSGPLGDTLLAINEAFGVPVIASEDVVEDKTSPSISGALTADEALQRALESTGLTAKQSPNGAYVIAVQTAATDTSPQQTVAQVEAIDEPRVEDAIVVTGTKQNLSLQQTQASVELFTEEQIEEEVLFSIDDVLLRTANVSVQNVQTGFSIRGVDQNGVGFTGTGRTSQLYVDGHPLSSRAQQGAQSLWDVGQVEVLRGPQSTVQGRNALAGAIIISTLDPTYDWEVRGRLQAASQETFKGSAAISGPIIEDQLALRIAYDYQTYDGGVEEVFSGIPQEFEDSTTLRGKLLVEPDVLPRLRLELTGEYVETEFGEFNTILAPVAGNDPAISQFDPFGGATFTRVRLEFPETTKFIANAEYELSDNWDLVGIATYEDNERFQQFGTPSAAQPDPDLFAATTLSETVSYELRAAFDYDRLSGWFGAYYFEDEEEFIQSFTIPVAIAPFPATPADSVIISNSTQLIETENRALFGEVRYAINDKWEVTLGARYDEEDFVDGGSQGTVESDPPDCVFDLGPGGALPCALLLPSSGEPATPTTYDAFLPRGTVTYNFDPDKSLSFSIQRGYRAGGAIQRVVPEAGITEIVEFDPEFVTNYEVAYRSLWMDGRLTLNANAFFTDWTDQQVTVPGPSGFISDSVILNAGESEIYGLEVYTDYQATDDLNLFASIGLLETEFTDFPFASVPGEFENLAGNSFPAAPSLSGAVGANYENPNGYYASGSLSFRSSQDSEVANLDVNVVDGYTLANARIGYRFDNFNIYAFGNNLFDERFVTRKDFAAVNTGTGDVNFRNNARFQVNEPQIIGVGIDFEY